MAPWTPSQRGSQSASSRQDLDPVTQIHNRALQTPTHLAEQVNASKSRYADSSSSDDNVHDIEADDDFSPTNTTTTRAGRHSHSRSMNIPLPSIFGGRKKRQENSGRHPSHSVPANRNASQLWPPQGGHHKRRSDSGSQDFATGTCMTCASLMRWPKGLKVFKCTICTTINDLEPLWNNEQRSGAGNVRSGRRPDGQQQKGGRTVSTEHTNAIIQQCLNEHIRKWSSDAGCNKSLRLADRTTEQSRPDTNRPAGTGYKSIDPGLHKNWAGADADGGVPIYVSKYEFDEEPTLQRPHPRKEEQHGRGRPSHNPSNIVRTPQPTMTAEHPKHIFKALEEYIHTCFTSFECINFSFLAQPGYSSEAKDSAGNRLPRESSNGQKMSHQRHESDLPTLSKSHDAGETGWETHELDPKLLLLGGFAENGAWWLGSPEEEQHDVHARVQRPKKASLVSSRSPQIHWKALSEWYSLIISPARDWFQVYEHLSSELSTKGLTERDLQRLEGEFLVAQEHVQKTLLKSIETLMKRPGRPLVTPVDVRFLMIILENPLLHPKPTCFQGLIQPNLDETSANGNRSSRLPMPSSGLFSGQHSGIIKRIFGLISNSSAACHNFMISWLGRYQHERFVRAKDLATGFLTYRMLRQGEKKRDKEVDITAGLIPQMQAGRSGAYLHDEIGSSSKSTKPKESPKAASYTDDWQIKATARFLALIFAANNMPVSKRIAEDLTQHESMAQQAGIVSRGHRLHISDFYNSLVDNIDLISDFEAWESKKGRFTFCQYPFLLSIWAKTKVLEHDTRRQMQNKARDAFFDTIMTSKNVNPFLVLDIRRDCLVEDSLTAVSEVIGSGGEDIKKGLRITFKGEEGIDAGGLRKEWFLLLIREVFNPDHGMFTYDEDSQYCYFNPNSFETSDQFFLVGVVMGLAIYNSTILDVALPPFVFRKLLASAPTVGVGIASAHPRPKMRYTLDDLAEFRPRLAHGLKALLDFDGDIQDVFALDFVISVERYGSQSLIPLCPGGQNKPVTNDNCREYVDLYVRYILDSSVSRQFEPFKRGFYTVCGGNAFSLLRPEEIDLLVRGSDEPLDIPSLRAVAEYHNWTTKTPDGSEPAATWFWETFEAANPADQRRLLSFITGSDRVPATGTATLPINVSCLGDDSSRFPVARTCFNQISLWRYLSKQKLEYMLWTAVHESEGFGLK